MTILPWATLTNVDDTSIVQMMVTLHALPSHLGVVRRPDGPIPISVLALVLSHSGWLYLDTVLSWRAHIA